MIKSGRMALKHVHVFVLAGLMFTILSSGAMGSNVGKFDLTGAHSFQNGELRLRVSANNIGTKPLSISGFSVYPSGTIDRFGLSTFRTISTSPGPTSKAGKVLAIRVDPNRSVQFEKTFRPIPLSLIHIDLVGGSEGDEVEFRTELNEEVVAGSYEMIADIRFGRCAKDTEILAENGVTRQMLLKLRGHKNIKILFGTMKIPR